MSWFGTDVRHLIFWGVVVLAIWALAAYFLLPIAWTHHQRQPRLAAVPMVTRTRQGIAGDPINVGLVGSEEDVIRAMHAAGWMPADPVTLKSSIAIIGSVLLRPARPAGAGEPALLRPSRARISPSRRRSAAAPTGATMCASGRCWIAARRGAGLARRGDL